MILTALTYATYTIGSLSFLYGIKKGYNYLNSSSNNKDSYLKNVIVYDGELKECEDKGINDLVESLFRNDLEKSDHAINLQNFKKNIKASKNKPNHVFHNICSFYSYLDKQNKIIEKYSAPKIKMDKKMSFKA